ncbi:AraC family transcriptional regulator [Microbacterium sp. MYb45]|nr:AraC family transcriptional regulator [Microbacterium sp. MYb45]
MVVVRYPSIQRYEVFRAGALPIASNDVPALGGIPEHTHDYLEIAVVSRGTGVHVTREGRLPIARGSVIIIRPGSWHAYRDTDELWTFNLYLAPELLLRELSWIVEYPDLARALLGGEPNLGEFDEESCARVLSWLEQITQHSRTVHAPTLIGLATCVLDSFSTLALSPQPATDSTIARSVITMMNLMQDDLSARWTIADLSRVANFSPAVVHRVFKTHVGISPMAWLTRARGEAAATQLALTDKSVSEVGQAVGWDDANYASRRFRALYGLTPSEYRSRFQRDDAAILR